ncbi:hypothetical protein HWB05_gp160 [Streptomyces phage BRock]|uniref:Uncharacterized protein n=1 Tax=Streptomyces phage BRock TaxID=1913591 RepID=A0A1J0GW67_9CAUD|nr:hypothetical protein HWB05_gp160 [Streptomyces phage BRock]APC46423.1 hypothetical protein [Streptomyces phage BRock]
MERNHEPWYEEIANTGRSKSVGYNPHMQVDTCWFHEGVHYPGEECPHETVTGEPGQEYPDGWTVQSK